MLHAAYLEKKTKNKELKKKRKKLKSITENLLTFLWRAKQVHRHLAGIKRVGAGT